MQTTKPVSALEKEDESVISNCSTTTSLKEEISQNGKLIMRHKIRKHAIKSNPPIPINNINARKLAEEIARLVGEKGFEENSISFSPLSLFGIEIGAKRRRCNLTIEELAGRTKISTDMLLSIEFGLASLDEVLNNLYRLSEGLGESSFRLSNLLTLLILNH